MTRPSPYFMRDQVRHRVRLIMRDYDRPSTVASLLWPLIAAVCALSFLNILSAVPPL